MNSTINMHKGRFFSMVSADDLMLEGPARQTEAEAKSDAAFLERVAAYLKTGAEAERVALVTLLELRGPGF